MKKILITYFEPFGGETVNAAMLAAECLKKSGVPAQFELLPTEYVASEERIRRLLDSIDPDYLLMLGQAAGRAALEAERIGVNLDHSAAADNAGCVRLGLPIDPDGPDGYFSTLPLNEMTAASAAAGIPAAVSNSAGTFVCNHVLYAALRHIRLKQLKTRAGFVHIPATPAQAASKRIASMDSATAAAGLAAMLSALQ